LLAIGHGSPDGLRIAIVLLGLRGVALAVWGLGLGLLRSLRPARSDAFDHMRGLGRKAPLAAAAMVLGGLSLVGFPLTAGFPGRWALWRLIASDYPAASWIVFFSAVSVALTYARGLAALISQPGPEEVAEDLEAERLAASVEDEGGEPDQEGVDEPLEASPPLGRRPAPAWLSIGLLGIGLTVLLALGLYPQWLLPAMAKAAEAFIRSSG
jgi:formate hydrogenlyase subunit 3/multisubunit Na+/H+ antiporter MnhD subunit